MEWILEQYNFLLTSEVFAFMALMIIVITIASLLSPNYVRLSLQTVGIMGVVFVYILYIDITGKLTTIPNAVSLGQFRLLEIGSEIAFITSLSAYFGSKTALNTAMRIVSLITNVISIVQFVNT